MSIRQLAMRLHGLFVEACYLVLWLLFGLQAVWLIAISGVSTRSELIGGITGSVRYPLASIEKIIVGLPDQMLIRRTGAIISPALKELYAEKQAASLLVIFQDGALLPLKLRAMANGSMLMDELVDRLQNLVARNYVYSDKEIKILRNAVPNMLIRKR